MNPKLSFRSRHAWQLALLLLMLPPMAARAAAEQAVQETRPLAADGHLHVENPAGSIRITAWDRNEVAVAGTLGANVEKLEIGGDARELSIVVRYPAKLRGGLADSELQLRVPRSARLSVDAVSAEVQIAGVSGALQVQSVSGDLNLDVASGSIDASTVSGDLQLRAPAASAKLNSVSGDVKASGLRGTLKADTVSGELQVDGGPFRQLSLQSVSGDLNLSVSLEDAGHLQAETLSGDIQLQLPASVNAQLDLKTFSGELHNGFAGNAAEGRKQSAKLGAGRGSIDLHSFSGDIRVTPAKR